MKFVNFRTLILSQLSGSDKQRRSVTSETLPLLNQGPETTLMFKKLIAQYAGIPLGKDLGLYCKAYEIMKRGFRWKFIRPREEEDDDDETNTENDGNNNNNNAGGDGGNNDGGGGVDN